MGGQDKAQENAASQAVPAPIAAPSLGPAGGATMALASSMGNQAFSQLARSSAPARAVPVARAAGTMLQRQGHPGTPTVPARPGPGRGSEVEPLPGKFEPGKTPGGTGFSAAKAIMDGVRKQLDRVALEAERGKAITALMAQETSIYDTLHANPGKGLTVNINFKSQDPATQPARPAEYNPQLKVEFLNVSVSAPFEPPEASEGPAFVPGAATAGDPGFGWQGHTLTASVRPVRPDPQKLKKLQVIDSVEALIAHMTANHVHPALVAGSLKTGARVQPPAGAQVKGPVVEVVAFGTKLLVVEQVAGQVTAAMTEVGRKQLKGDIAGSRREIGALQKRVDAAASEGSVSKWWNDRTFDVDPHLLDSPRAHLAAAKNFLAADDLANAYESWSACEDLLGLVRNQLHAYDTNDFSDPFGQDPVGIGDAVE